MAQTTNRVLSRPATRSRRSAQLVAAFVALIATCLVAPPAQAAPHVSFVLPPSATVEHRIPFTYRTSGVRPRQHVAIQERHGAKKPWHTMLVLRHAARRGARLKPHRAGHYRLRIVVLGAHRTVRTQQQRSLSVYEDAVFTRLDKGSDRREQERYATETVGLSYTRFMSRKADFTSHGCNADHPKPGGCSKPSPYNSFDWTTDGCSGRTVIRNVYRDLFNKPCELHDFGYRNFGKGLTLGHNENTRSWIDDRFLTEMVSLCNTTFERWWEKLNKVACVEEAGAVWGAVRHLSDWSQPVAIPDQNGTPAPGGAPGPGPGPSAGGPSVPSAATAVSLAQGPAAPAGFRYAITLVGYTPNTSVSVTCHDSVSPAGFYTFALGTDGAGSASTAAFCYSGDGPDHWVRAGGLESNHVAWSGGGPAAPAPPPAPPAPEPPPPAPATYTETTGGAANTWTNYTNAGGYAGPVIPAYTSVQIACKVVGFRVADGNTWWYRIASSPWNNNYYVSADAFYNNGQTSGSLHGTPFVDGNVRDC